MIVPGALHESMTGAELLLRSDNPVVLSSSDDPAINIPADKYEKQT